MKSNAFTGASMMALACLLCLHTTRAQTPLGAVCLDGTNDFVQASIGWLTTLSNVQNSFTIEMWVKPNAARTSTVESISGAVGTNGQQFAVFPDDGVIYLGTNHTGVGLSIGTNGISIFERTSTNYFPSPLVYVAPTPFTNWMHVALVYQARLPRLYVNGSNVRNGVTGVKVIHPSVNFGGGGVNFGNFDGCIDEVRVWSVTRTAGEIAANRYLPMTVPQANLIGYWRFDELSGTIATNLADTDLNSTLANGATRVDSGAQFLAIPVTIGASNVTARTADIHGEVNPNNATTTATLRYGLTPSPTLLGVNTNVGNGNLPVSVMASLSGLQPGALYYFRQDATGAGSVQGQLLSFQTDPLPPDAITENESSVTPTTANLNATVTANGPPTKAWFQWGLTTTNLNYISDAIDIGSGVNVPILLPVSNLIAGVNYYFRVFATNELGMTNGALQSFSTPLFTSFTISLSGLIDGQLAWGDFNRNGALDLAVTGSDSGSNPRAYVLTNSGTAFSVSVTLTGMTESATAWSDFNNDELLDLATVGRTNVSGGARPSSRLWRNSVSGFVSSNALPNAYQSAVAWGDYDNDGRQDVLVAGSDNLVTNTWLLRNTPAGFSNVIVPFPGVVKGSLAWGDYDNDGWLDVLIAGNTVTGRVFQLWRNTGGSFTNIDAGLPGLTDASVAWGDFNNDGLLDIAFSGTSLTNLHCDVWRNTGSGFTHFIALTKVTFGSLAWGDYDNDGWLDLLLTGFATSTPVTDLFHNNGGTNFSKVAFQFASFAGLQRSSVAWGDINNDGRLDVAMQGLDSGSIRQIDVWRNHTLNTNTLPSAPSNLAATLLATNSVLLTWDATVDAQTPSSALAYNVSVGTTSGGDEIMPSLSLTNGFRMIAAVGNLRRQQFALVTNVNFNSGPIHWAVQAVDTALAGGPFARSVLVGAPDVTTIPASNVTSNSATLNGIVTPGNLATIAWFEYGLSPAFGNFTANTNLSGGSNIVIAAELTNLFLGTTYYFRAAASNSAGIRYGVAFTFIPAVPPVPITLAANGFATNFNAAINGSVNPGGIPTTVFFEYGLTTAYGNATAAMGVGNGTNGVPVMAALSGLSLGGIYHYRLVSSNALGVTYGPDVTFGVNLVPGDLNFDGVVDLEELNLIIQHYRRLVP